MKATVPRARGEAASLAVILASVAALVGLRSYSYLLFHSIAELYSIIIAVTYFLFAWHTRKVNQQPAIAALGMAYLFVAVLDLFHALSYAGMGIFRDYAYPANQVWLVARSLEALALLVFPLLRGLSARSLGWLALASGAWAAAGLAAVFVFRAFPACYVEGLGQTAFKRYGEYAVMATLAAAALVVRLRRAEYPGGVYGKLQISIGLTALAEACFTLYLSNYDWVNVAGHVLKILSFYYLYRAIIVAGLERPQELLYGRLAASERDQRRLAGAQAEVISILSHDLKGPLGAMKDLAGASLAGEWSAEPARLRTLMEEIAKASGRSLDLLERVLGWAKATSGLLEPRPIVLDLARAAAEGIAPVEPVAEAKGVTLSVDLPAGAAVAADREMLNLIVRNLAQNAVKFTHSGGSVTIGAVREGDAWALSVADTGIGMDAETLARVWNAKTRVRGADTQGNVSTGLGLVLSSEYAGRMGGRIEARSEPGKGSVFTLRLPAAPQESSRGERGREGNETVGPRIPRAEG